MLSRCCRPTDISTRVNQAFIAAWRDQVPYASAMLERTATFTGEAKVVVQVSDLRLLAEESHYARAALHVSESRHDGGASAASATTRSNEREWIMVTTLWSTVVCLAIMFTVMVEMLAHA